MYALLHQTGRLTDLSRGRTTPAGTPPDGGAYVALAAWPDFPGPYLYDPARARALPDTAAQAEAAQAEAEGQQAASDLDAERPQLRSLLAQALAALTADETQRAADLLALSTATAAQQRATLGRLLQREALRIRLDERLLRAVAGQLGIPANAQGLR